MLDYFVMIDCLGSAAGREANALFPAAVLSETDGTFLNASGELKPLAASSRAPGEARKERVIVSELARAMGLAGFEYESVGAITTEVPEVPPPKPFSGNPRHNARALPARFRGHYTADLVKGLQSLGLPSSPPEVLEQTFGEGFAVLDKKELVPNMHMVRVKAPQIARFAKPGQFVIVMVKETSERIPYTLVDWNGDEGWITLVVEEVGRSSREIATLSPGSTIAHVSGPLGLPFSVEKKGTVVLGGGCYGIGAIYRIAKALKDVGNRVISVIEASSHYLLYMEEELKEVSDELIIATKDGTRGVKGGVQDIFAGLVENGTKVDEFVAIGCTFMMRMVCEKTKALGVPTRVALNPIMVDGTGMCGACRVSIDGRTLFACVDGPIFDGHAVDWDELFSRRGAYAREEIESLPQMMESAEHRHEGGCGCGHK